MDSLAQRLECPRLQVQRSAAGGDLRSNRRGFPKIFPMKWLLIGLGLLFSTLMMWLGLILLIKLPIVVRVIFVVLGFVALVLTIIIAYDKDE